MLLYAGICFAQSTDLCAEDAANKYWIKTDVVYGVENGHTNKLDVIYPHNATEAVPAVIYIHGGGWIWFDKGGSVLQMLPYLKMGWAAVNVEYRLAERFESAGCGSSDDVVPYDHAVHLHTALDRAGVPNQLITVEGGGHGQFADVDNR